MDKKYFKVPEGKFERLIMSAELAEQLSGEKVSREEVLSLVSDDNIELTSEQFKFIENRFQSFKKDICHN